MSLSYGELPTSIFMSVLSLVPHHMVNFDRENLSRGLSETPKHIVFLSYHVIQLRTMEGNGNLEVSMEDRLDKFCFVLFFTTLFIGDGRKSLPSS